MDARSPRLRYRDIINRPSDDATLSRIEALEQSVSDLIDGSATNDTEALVEAEESARVSYDTHLLSLITALDAQNAAEHVAFNEQMARATAATSATIVALAGLTDSAGVLTNDGNGVLSWEEGGGGGGFSYQPSGW